MSSPHRYEHLDAMRGYAALAVAFCHSVATFSGVPERTLLGGMTGRVPVLFFFILSGFVLGKSLQREERFGIKAYVAFYIRRFFRLYPPFFAASVVAVVVAKVLITVNGAFNGPPNGWAMLMERNMVSVASIPAYLKEFLLYDMRLNCVAWALRVEFICSIFLPMLHQYTLRRPNWVPTILLFLIILRFPLSVEPFSALGSIQYLFVFYIGYLISRADLLWVKEVGFNRWNYPLFFGIVVLVCAMRRDSFDDLSAVFLLSGFFILLVFDLIPGLRWILQARFSRVLGNCSYSFYLIFTPILIVVMYGSGISFPRQPLICGVMLFLVCVPLALALSIFLEKTVEIPFNKLGHRISNRMHQRPRKALGNKNAATVRSS